jgi:hypothetical protein
MRIFKSTKKAVAWMSVLLVLMCLMVYGGYRAIRSPRVQTKVTQFIAAKLSEQLGAEITLAGVDIGFFNRLILEGLFVEDLHGDTLASIHRLHLGLRGVDFKQRQVLVDRITLDSLYFHLHRYEGEQGMNIQFLIDFFGTKEKDTTQRESWDLRFREVQLTGARFKLYDDNKPLTGRGMDYRHLDVSDIDLLVRNIRIEGDTIRGRVDGLSCREGQGFRLSHLAGDVTVSPVELKVDGLRIRTPESDIALDLHYTYSRWGDWLSFVDDVRMSHDFDDSEVSINDVAFFVPPLTGLGKMVRISGRVSGPVTSLRGRGLNIWYGNGTNLQGDVDMDGLPNIEETFMYLNLRRLVTSHDDLVTIPLPPFKEGRTLPVPINLRRMGKVNFTGKFTGFITDFVAYGRLTSEIGELRTDIALRQELNSTELSYEGKLESKDFNVGRLMGLEENMGRVSLNAAVKGSGLDPETISATLIGKVKYAELRGYSYRNIDVNGAFVNNRFDGELCIDEQNIVLDFNGSVNLTGKLPQFDFHAEVDHADLYRLNLLPDRVGATVSGVLDVNFTGNDIDNILGNIVLSEATYRQKGDRALRLERLRLEASEAGGVKTLDLRSDVADARFVGQFAFRNIPKAVNNILAKHLPSYASGFEGLAEGEGFEFVFDAEVRNAALLSYFVVPKLRVTEHSHFKGNYSTSRNEVKFEGEMPGFTYDSIDFSGVRLLAENPGKEFEITVTADRVAFTDSLFLDALNVSTYTFNDSLGLRIRWDNGTKLRNRADINGLASFPRNAQVSFRLLPSTVTVADLDWTVTENNRLTIDSSTFHFTDMTFNNNEQTIGLNGYISRDPERELEVGLRYFNLANLNILTQRSGITLNGRVSGEAQLKDLYKQAFVTNRLRVDSLRVNEVSMGSGSIINTWLPGPREVDVMADLNRKDGTGLKVSGRYMPGADRDQNFNLVIRGDNLPVALATPYVKKVISDLKGTARADLTLKGKSSAPELEGYVDLNGVSLMFDYLNVRFGVNDRVLVRKDGFYMKDLTVTDERGKEGKINGWVKHDGFRDVRFDANISVSNFLALNTTSALNPLYYGRALGSGVVRFSGVPSQMHLEVAMRTDRGSRFFIPLFGVSTVRESSFITFVSPPGAEEEEVIEPDFQIDFSNLTMDLDVQVTPDAEVQLIFDPTMGDIIRGSGLGDIRLAVDRTGEFKMFGEFTITKGDYLFTLQNIINKRFSVKPGGTVNWSGSPYNAQVNLQAVYALRATLAELMYPDTSAIYQRRMQVECVLNMTNNLLNPDITFDIDLPNADQSAKTDVINRIGVGNDQEMNRQVFGLLVLNRFLPREDQNIGSETGGFFTANSAEMLSNQLSNWLSRISNDFDVGLNYRPGSDIAGDEVEVALSTQLFNSRIIVDGNVGVANNRAAGAGAQSSSNIVGDVNIEYKITQDGRFRVRAFNRSNDVGANALVSNNAPFTQGVGISFRRDFNTFSGLFKKNRKTQENALDTPRLTPMLPEELDSDRLGD